MAIVLSQEWKLRARDECYKIVVAELGKLSSIVSWQAPK